MKKTLLTYNKLQNDSKVSWKEILIAAAGTAFMGFMAVNTIAGNKKISLAFLTVAALALGGLFATILFLYLKIRDLKKEYPFRITKVKILDKYVIESGDEEEPDQYCFSTTKSIISSSCKIDISKKIYDQALIFDYLYEVAIFKNEKSPEKPIYMYYLEKNTELADEVKPFLEIAEE